MIIYVETQPYNKTWYGKPWIARVVKEHGAAERYQFGSWAGLDGGGGELSLDCLPGDMLAHGQQVLIAGWSAVGRFGWVNQFGAAVWGCTKVQARIKAAEVRAAIAASIGPCD